MKSPWNAFRIIMFVALAMAGRTSGDESASRSGAALPAGLIKVTDVNVARGLSPLNWVRTDGYVSASTGGAWLDVGFTGTRSVALCVDTSGIRVPAASRFPIIAWSVNGGPEQMHQLAAGEASIVLCTDKVDPEIDLFLKGFSPFEDRFDGDVPPNAVTITGFAVDAGGATVAGKMPAKRWLNIGDSIMSGDAAAYTAGQGRPPDGMWAAATNARASYAYLLAHHYGYSESRIAYGGYDWNGGLAHLPGVETLIDQITSTVSRVNADGKLVPNPDVLLINLGENGTPSLETVVGALKKVRRRVNPTTKIVMMIPVSGKGRGPLTAAFNSYKKGENDPEAYLVDLGPISFATADHQHPTAAGHETIFHAALAQFDKILGKSGH